MNFYKIKKPLKIFFQFKTKNNFQILSNSNIVSKPKTEDYINFYEIINKPTKIQILENTLKTDPLKNNTLQFPIENNSCIIPNVLILSKIGTEAYIEFDEISIKIEDEEYKTMRFVIPSSSIITYNIISK